MFVAMYDLGLKPWYYRGDELTFDLKLWSMLNVSMSKVEYQRPNTFVKLSRFRRTSSIKLPLLPPSVVKMMRLKREGSQGLDDSQGTGEQML